MTTPSSPTSPAPACAAFEDRLGAWLEGELDDRERAEMERHHAECASCAALVSALDGIVQDAAALPALAPSRDLWSGIDARLDAPVISLDSRREQGAVAGASARATGAPRGISVRRFAVAAAALVAVSSGVTWQLARSGGPAASGVATPSVAVATPSAATPAPTQGAVVPTINAPQAEPAVASAVTPAVGAASASVSAPVSASPRGERTPSRLVSTRSAGTPDAESVRDVDAIYEKEIAALRRIVNQRFTELDTATVSALRSNLQIIDRAIEDSRRALRRDPRSGMLSTQLDRTLEAKLALMRRVALL